MTLRIYGDLALQSQSALKLLDAANGYSVKLRAPSSLSTDTTFQLPSSLGQNNQVMVTDANGQFSFAFLADANVASNAAISLSKLAALTVSKALVSDANGVVSASNVTAAEIGHLSGVTSSVQGQLDFEAAARASAISAEQAARESGDASLQSQINHILSNSDPAALDSLSEIVAAFQAADANLNNAISALGTGATSGLAAEVSRAEAAEANLQSQINSEVSNRQSAVSSEASQRSAADSALQLSLSTETSNRQSADTALGARIDALATTSLTDVAEADKHDKDLFQWDSAAGKWKNVAPISAAATTTTVTPGTPAIPGSETKAYYNAGGAFGGTFFCAVGANWGGSTWSITGGTFITTGGTADSLSKVRMRLSTRSRDFTSQVAGLSQTGTIKLAAKTSKTGPVLGYSSEVELSSISSDPNVSSWVEFNFASANLTLNANTKYFFEWVFSNSNSGIAFEAGGTGSSSNPGYWHSGGGGEEHPEIHVIAEIYTGSPGTPGTPDVYTTVAKTGVVRTNSDGFIDSSFLKYDVDLGGHKLKGVSAPTQDTEASNKKYVDDQVASEASARAAAVSSEAEARQAAVTGVSNTLNNQAELNTYRYELLFGRISSEVSFRQQQDANLQGQIDALSGNSSSSLSGEIARAEAAEGALSGRLDVIEGTGAGSIKKAVADLVNGAPAMLDTLKELADAIGDDANYATTVANHIADERASREAADATEQAARVAADNALGARLNVVEGSDSTPGSIAKAKKDAQDYAATLVDSHKAKADWSTGTSFTLNHNWNTKDVLVQVYDSTTGETLTVDVTRGLNSVSFAAASSAAMWRVIAFNLGAASSSPAPTPTPSPTPTPAPGGNYFPTINYMSGYDMAGIYQLSWYGSNLSGKYVMLQRQMAGIWTNVGGVGPASMNSGSTMTALLSNGDTLRFKLYEDMSYMTPTSPEAVSSSFTATIASAPPPPPPGPSSYSIWPNSGGVTVNGNTVTISWDGSYPMAGIDMVYLVPVSAPAVYDDSAKVGLGLAMSTIGSAVIPASATGTYVLRIYNSMTMAPVVTSSEFGLGYNGAILPPV